MEDFIDGFRNRGDVDIRRGISPKCTAGEQGERAWADTEIQQMLQRKTAAAVGLGHDERHEEVKRTFSSPRSPGSPAASFLRWKVHILPGIVKFDEKKNKHSYPVFFLRQKVYKITLPFSPRGWCRISTIGLAPRKISTNVSIYSSDVFRIIFGARKYANLGYSHQKVHTRDYVSNSSYARFRPA